MGSKVVVEQDHCQGVQEFRPWYRDHRGLAVLVCCAYMHARFDSSRARWVGVMMG